MSPLYTTLTMMKSMRVLCIRYTYSAESKLTLLGMIRGSAQCSGSYKKMDIRISDEKPDYGEEAGEEMILHTLYEG